MFGLSPIQLLICGIVAVLLFGSRLPNVARSLGKSLTEFRRGLSDLQSEFNDAMRDAERTAGTQSNVGATAQSRLTQAARNLHDDSAPEGNYDTYVDQPPEEGERRGELADDASLADEAPSEEDPADGAAAARVEAPKPAASEA
ncbi:twin-arginine translocase TatA/TatE family subunit [Botrimarina sp.]|uniref:twin-arginine translocase TatA/TatE family subunit n=1 Tax=Botrimarina sp. TaxID=2795802 RepID=UPI0032EF9CAD